MAFSILISVFSETTYQIAASIMRHTIFSSWSSKNLCQLKQHTFSFPSTIRSNSNSCLISLTSRRVYHDELLRHRHLYESSFPRKRMSLAPSLGEDLSDVFGMQTHVQRVI